jgi:DMSO/TMAO reductase YedYZ molybdopterin-dependent catalytic subunit
MRPCIKYFALTLIACILSANLGFAADTAPCTLKPLPIPPTPEKIPGYTELDTSTGLHVTGTLPRIDINSYRLTVTGKVAHPGSYTYNELRCMERVEARPALVCPGFFVDTATWAGVPLRSILDKVGVKPDAKEIRLKGGDNYYVTVPVEVARKTENFLAYEWEGNALPLLHGFPLRAVFPDEEGNRWVKWLMTIEVQ